MNYRQKVLHFVSVFLSVVFIFVLSTSTFASSPVEYAESLVGSEKSNFPFNTSSPWCVRFARWFNEQYSIESYSKFNECNSVFSDDVLKVFNQNELNCFDWVLLDTDNNGYYNHCVVYLGNETYVGGNENDTVAIHHGAFSVPFVGIRSKVVPSVVNTKVVSPVGPEDANGFKAVMLNLIGTYEAIVNEYQYTNSNGYTSYVREITPDYVWMISAGIFIVIMWCIFRLTAFLVGGGKRK